MKRALRLLYTPLEILLTIIGLYVGYDWLTQQFRWNLWSEFPSMTLEEALNPRHIERFHHSLASTENWSGAASMQKGSQVLYEKAFNPQQVNIDRELHNLQFPINSISKSITATAVLKLQEQDLLTIEDSVCKHLNSFCKKPLNEISLEHLLSHQSGLRSLPLSLPGFATSFLAPFTHISLPTILKYQISTNLQFRPGQRFKYENINHIVMAAVLEKVMQKPFEQVIDELVFQPLGMSHSYVETETSPSIRRVGYLGLRLLLISQPLIFKSPLSERFSSSYAAGAMISTLHDLHRWAQALMSSEYLSKQSLELLFKPRRQDYALSLVELRHKPTREKFYFHNGASMSFKSEIYFFPDRKVSLVSLSNRSVARVVSLKRAYSQFHRSLAGQTFQLPMQPLRVPIPEFF